MIYIRRLVYRSVASGTDDNRQGKQNRLQREAAGARLLFASRTKSVYACTEIATSTARSCLPIGSIRHLMFLYFFLCLIVWSGGSSIDCTRRAHAFGMLSCYRHLGERCDGSILWYNACIVPTDRCIHSQLCK